MEQKTALLIMDMQQGILQNYPAMNVVTEHAARAIEKAHAKGIQVIYVTLLMREGLPEVNPNNKMFAAFRQRLEGVSMDDFSKVHTAIAPQQGDIIVHKKRVSAFAGSDLDIILRAQGIQHVVLAGVATSGVVLSTLREAADKDYKITVLADCCMDADEEVHRVLTQKVFLRQADVVTVAEWE